MSRVKTALYFCAAHLSGNVTSRRSDADRAAVIDPLGAFAFPPTYFIFLSSSEEETDKQRWTFLDV